MDFQMNSVDRNMVQMQVDSMNSTLKVESGRLPKTELGKDDFLQILLTQLTHQDPTAPMEDTQFIAQMAQFSTLEQMTNMSGDFAKISAVLGSGEAMQSVGKEVEITTGEDSMIRGTVEAVSRGAEPMIFVNGNYYNWKDVSTVYGN